MPTILFSSGNNTSLSPANIEYHAKLGVKVEVGKRYLLRVAFGQSLHVACARDYLSSTRPGSGEDSAAFQR